MKELTLRITFGLLYVLVILLSFYYGLYSFTICVYILITLCILEYSKLIKHSLLKLLLSFNIIFLLTSASFYLKHPIYIPVYRFIMILGVFIHSILGIKVIDPSLNKIDISGISKYYMITSGINLFMIACNPFLFKYDYRIVISIFVLIWCNDSFAFVFGKTMGKTKLLPKISPKKTIEGALGGLVACLIACFFLSKYNADFPLVFWMFLAILVSILGTLGDLVQSSFKRKANVKDSGNILPGHGGMFDRLDSVLFISPYVLLMLSIINYVS